MKPALLVVACASLLAPGCGLYTGGHGASDAGPCYETPPSNLSVRNPESGQCVTFTSGGACSVVNGGAAPGSSAPSSGVFTPTWGLCTSQCTGLGENACLATSACQAAYLDTGESVTPDGVQPTKAFYGCWATDKTGPVEGGGCAGLDANACSRHDDCITIHSETCKPGVVGCSLGEFESCAPEPGKSCTSDADCGAGHHCDFSPCPFDCPAGVPCTCQGTCVADSNPGGCYGDVTCDTKKAPTCPAGTVPEIANGCYTGYCIPEDQCGTPPPLPACDTITDEATCIGRPFCTPIYQGQDCSCDPSGACTCQTWVFSRCQDAPHGTPAMPVDGGSAPTGAPDGGSAPAL